MKSNFRKVALLLATLALLCSALFVGTATVSAADEPTLVVTDAEGKAGDEVTVQIKLENNPGIVSAVTRVRYDASVLEFVSCEAEGSYADARPVINTDKYPTKNPVVINFCDAIADADYTEELFATFVFKIKDDAAAGVYPFTLTCDYEGDWYNLNWDIIEFTEQVGAVTVIGDEPVCAHEYDCDCDPDCNLCGEIREVSHHIEHIAAVAPTCFENGNIEYWFCDVCGQVWLDEACTLNSNLKAVILPMAHCELTHVEAKAPTCFEDGNIEYWYCEACGYAWLDAEGTLPTNLKAVILPMTHCELTHVEAVAPTCFENGNIEYWYCEACGYAWLDAEGT
ncbi:MAG: hypothetical protein IKL13_02200, partial [Clostridia bacterium]|nr:hypothetical protein [Clostridia bacterium]